MSNYIKLTGKEGEPVSILKAMAATQRDLVSLEEWTTENLPRIHKDTCKVLHLQQKNPMQLYRLDTGWRPTSLKKDPRVLADSKLNISQWCGLAAKAGSLPECMNRSSASRLSQVIISLGIH